MRWGLGNGSRIPGTLILLVVVALVLILRAKLPVEEWLGPVRDWVGGFGTSGAVVLGLGIMVATAFGMPGSVMAIAAGVALGMGIGMLAAWLGITAGSCLCFFISRWVLGGRVNAYIEGRPRLSALKAAVGTRGWKVLLMLRLTPLVPLVVTNYVAGVSGVRFPHAALAAAMGILPATLVYVGLGAAGGSDAKTPAVLVLVGLAATIGLGMMARKILSEVMAA
jgi:uncharacterized membrane protein YdjX (TVP38/TMEM64 family)